MENFHKAAGCFSGIDLIVPLGWEAESSGFGLFMGIYICVYARWGVFVLAAWEAQRA